MVSSVLFLDYAEYTTAAWKIKHRLEIYVWLF